MEASFKKAAEAYKSLALAKKQLERITVRIKEAKEQLAKLDKIVDKEYKEYQDLENASLRKLFNNSLSLLIILIISLLMKNTCCFL